MKTTDRARNGAGLGRFGRRLRRRAAPLHAPSAAKRNSFGARVAARELPLPTLLRRSIMSLAMTAIGRQPKFKRPATAGISVTRT